ncbi:MAG: restriction endonuclease subunit S [Clostridia bacterium]|nr:restriction endonuclease subunit S [Clostridia bacterium]
MIDTQVLKKKILKLAFQGKLTEQLPQDESVVDWLNEIDSISEEIHRNEIFRNKKKVVVREISDNDIPYELPQNWCWVRLGRIADVFGRIGFRGYTKGDIVDCNSGALAMSPSNISSNGKLKYDVCTYITWEKYEESPEIMVKEKDILIVKTGSSYGKSALVDEVIQKSTINPQLAIIKFVRCDVEYLDLCLKSATSWSQFERFVVGAATPTFSQECLYNLLVPIPSVEEQKRVVNVIRKAFDLIELIELNQSRFESNKEALKSAIIDLGISGKLTKRLPDDGTAEEFYSLIQMEKQRLIKEKKIKKDKPLLDIDDSELIGTCPKEWKMVRLGEVIHLQSGQDLTSDLYSDEEIGIPYLTGASNFNDNGDLIINRWTNAPKSLAYRNDVLLSVKGTVGKLKILDYDSVHIARQIMAIRGILIDKDYLKYYLESQLGKIKRASKGLIPGIERSDIRNMIIALPPLKEQKRIVMAISSAIELLQSENV